MRATVFAVTVLCVALIGSLAFAEGETKAAPAKIVTTKAMGEFNAAVAKKLEALPEAQQEALVKKLEAINGKVLALLATAEALEPAFEETVATLKKANLDTTALVPIIKELDGEKPDAAAISGKFNQAVLETMKSLDEAAAKKLVADLQLINQKIIESPKINPAVRKAMDEVVKELEANKIDTTDLKKLY